MIPRFVSSKSLVRTRHRPGTPLLLGLTIALVTPGLTATLARADDWPQWLGPRRDGVWRENGIVERFGKDGPKVRWRTPVAAGYAGPAVADGRVYVTDRVLASGVANPSNAFAKDRVKGKERVLCLDEATGKQLWSHEYDCTYQVSYAAGPRCTPVVHEGRVYTLGTMGDLLCLEAASGKVLWSKNFPKDYKALVPMWGFAGHPLLDGERLICLVGGEGSAVVAFNAQTGKEIWRALTVHDRTHGPGYGPPMIFTAGGKRQLIAWHPEGVTSLNPETGEVYWSKPFPLKAGMSIATPRHTGDMLLVSSFYNGSMMLKLDRDAPRAEVLWKGKGKGETPRLTDGLHSVIGTPFIKDGYIYGVCSYGQLRGLKADTGERLWETLAATTGKEERWANAFIVAQGERFFLFNDQGDLIIARLTPKGYDEISRAHILEPTNTMANGRPLVWSHPAFANRSMYARNDKEIVCVSLAENGSN